MRTLVLVPELYRAEGGIARILRLYIRALAEEARTAQPDSRARLQVVVLNDGTPGPSWPGVVLHACGRSKPAFLGRALRQGWSAERVVCGHVHLLPVCWLLQGIRPRLRYFLVAHGIEVWREFSWVERRALTRATRILCVSAHTRRELLKHAPELDPARLVVTANAVDLEFWGGAAGAAGLATGFGSPALVPGPGSTAVPEPRLLTVARLTSADREKGVETVLRAMPAIRAAWPRARLRVVGSGDDEARLRAVADALDLVATGAVEFTGAVDDAALREEYAACELFVLPSRKEGFGMVYLEAMACGKPCIAADAGGAPEVVAVPDCGALVPFGDPAAIAAAVSELVARPRAPGKIRAWAASFGYDSFQERVRVALRA